VLMLPIWALGYDDNGFCFSDQKQPHSCTRSLTLIEESEDGLIDGLRDRSIDITALSFPLTRSAAYFSNQSLKVNDAKRKIDMEVRFFAFDCTLLGLFLYM
jgi:hypothetical protein